MSWQEDASARGGFRTNCNRNVKYDKIGRQRYIVDYTNHGYLNHFNPHLHERIYENDTISFSCEDIKVLSVEKNEMH